MVSEGDTFEIERQPKPLSLDVLFYSDGDEIIVGKPTITDVKVDAEIVEEKKDKKIRVARFKSKSRYRRVRGHRQPLSVVKVNKISKGTTTKIKKEDKK